MGPFVLDFPRVHRRRVLREWLVAGVLLLSALALFSTIWNEHVSADAETIAVAVAVLLMAYPVPVTLLVAWQSTFSARVAVIWEGDEAESGASPPWQSPSRRQRQSGKALARSWRRVESLARSQGVAGLEELGVGSIRDASRPTVDVDHGLAVVEGLLEALGRAVELVDEGVVADLRNIQRELATRSRDGGRFSLVMLV
jgi:hypothetical protein